MKECACAQLHNNRATYMIKLPYIVTGKLTRVKLTNKINDILHEYKVLALSNDDNSYSNYNSKQMF